MGAHDGSVDHHVFVVAIACQQLENAIKSAALRPPAETLVYDLAVAETRGQITTGNLGSVSVKNRIDEQPVVRCMPPRWPSRPGRKSLIRSHWSSRNPKRSMGRPSSKPIAHDHSTTELEPPTHWRHRIKERRSPFDSVPFSLPRPPN
jgi:hypothetical protein